jgi:hypothetical protein
LLHKLCDGLLEQLARVLESILVTGAMDQEQAFGLPCGGKKSFSHARGDDVITRTMDDDDRLQQTGNLLRCIETLIEQPVDGEHRIAQASHVSHRGEGALQHDRANRRLAQREVGREGRLTSGHRITSWVGSNPLTCVR